MSLVESWSQKMWGTSLPKNLLAPFTRAKQGNPGVWCGEQGWICSNLKVFVDLEGSRVCRENPQDLMAEDSVGHPMRPRQQHSLSQATHLSLCKQEPDQHSWLLGMGGSAAWVPGAHGASPACRVFCAHWVGLGLSKGQSINSRDHSHMEI